MKKHHSVLILSSLMAFSGLSGCQTSIQEACNEQLPGFEKEISEAIVSISGETAKPTERAERALASAAEHRLPALRLDSKQKKHWKNWAEERLTEVQGYLDVSATDPNLNEVSQTLSDMGLELVVFHGYAEKSDPGRMIASLEKIRAKDTKVRQLVCGK